MTFEVPVIARFKENTNLMVVCVAKKIHKIDKIVWPMQEKYS
jgi:Trk K+ transport system NAD-binding subunit